MRPQPFDPDLAARLSDPSPAGDLDAALARVMRSLARLPAEEPPPTPADVARLRKRLGIGRE